MSNISSSDYNGNRIYVGDDVLVPKPNEVTDIYKKEFVGRIKEFRNNGSAEVTNNEGEIFNFIPNKLEGLPKEILSGSL